jgi:hypothetical protein
MGNVTCPHTSATTPPRSPLTGCVGIVSQSGCERLTTSFRSGLLRLARVTASDDQDVVMEQAVE